MQFFQKFTLWGSPCSCPTPWCLWGWTSPRWSWMSGKTLNQPSFTCWTTFASTTFPKNQSLGMSGLRSSRNLSAPPTLIRAGNLECHIHIWNLGVKPDPMVPHTWGFGSSFTIPQGGVVAIYIRILYQKLNLSILQVHMQIIIWTRKLKANQKKLK